LEINSPVRLLEFVLLGIYRLNLPSLSGSETCSSRERQL